MNSRALILAIDIALRGVTRQHAHARRLFVSLSQVNRDLKLLRRSRLLSESNRVGRRALIGVLFEGVPHFYPAHLGQRALGIPTSITARLFDESEARLDDIVWPTKKGDTRGPSVEPLYPTVPDIALADKRMYRVLAAIDALRLGEARDVTVARKFLKMELLGE